MMGAADDRPKQDWSLFLPLEFGQGGYFGCNSRTS
jgi:hypothetical protein